MKINSAHIKDIQIVLDVCRKLQAGLVHADLKPANIMWSSLDSCFKCLDFGLTFHIEEDDLHQIQSTGKHYLLLGRLFDFVRVLIISLFEQATEHQRPPSGTGTKRKRKGGGKGNYMEERTDQ